MNIGIFTMYPHNDNYGGVLQSYALPTFCNQHFSSQAYQIPTDHSQGKNLRQRPVLKRYTDRANWATWLSQTYYALAYQKDCQHRRQLFNTFAKEIPTANTPIQYDAYLVGSDQIWNPHWFYEPYYLTDVPEQATKIAYGASLGVETLSPKELQKMLPLIERFQAISVREPSAKTLLQPHLDRELSVVCDPVLLLEPDHWQQRSTSPLSGKDYVFAYLLGHRQENRELATQVAKAKDLPLAQIPYVHFRYNRYDAHFGDWTLPHVSPTDFLGLIRDTAYVVTDSYHGVLFSLIFQRPFVALLRNHHNESNNMNSRLVDLLTELNLQDRIVTTPEGVRRCLQTSIDYPAVNVLLTAQKAHSIAFLTQALWKEAP